MTLLPINLLSLTWTSDFLQHTYLLCIISRGTFHGPSSQTTYIPTPLYSPALHFMSSCQLGLYILARNQTFGLDSRTYFRVVKDSS